MIHCKYTESGYHDWSENMCGDVSCSRCYLPLYPIDCAKQRDRLHAELTKLKATLKESGSHE